MIKLDFVFFSTEESEELKVRRQIICDMPRHFFAVCVRFPTLCLITPLQLQAFDSLILHG